METSLEDPYPGNYVVTLLSNANNDLGFFIISAIVLIILLFLSGLVSGSEVAFFNIASKEDGSPDSGTIADQRVNDLLGHPKRLLATILILNNLINISIVTLSTFVVWSLIGSKSVESKVVLFLTVGITFAIVFFGEVVPKIYANQKSKTFVYFTIPLISIAYVFFKPVAWLLGSMTGFIEKRIKYDEYDLSMKHLTHALDLTTGQSSSEEKEILKGIVNFGQLNVTQVMKSRIDITAFDYDLDFHELMDKINKTGYSRIPVYKETIDNIAGILYNKDLLPFINEKEDFTWQKLLRPGFFVPETKKIDTLLKDFQNKRVHMAIVVDEYGGTSGLITLEDVIEEIVGEINDEYDDEDINYSRIDDRTFIFEGKVSLNDFCKVTGQDPAAFENVKGESESLGGLILEIRNKLPHAGEVIKYDKFAFTVVAVDPKKIKRVRVLIDERM